MKTNLLEIPVTPEDFKATIETLLGHGAQRKFARFIGRDDTTVRRWVSGARKLPPEVPLILALMWERQRMGLPHDVNVERAMGEIINQNTADN
jgi:hypothetical protein